MGKRDLRHLMGLDIGSNSVGSAWIDLQARNVCCGVSVFPAGVDETEDARGAPKNQERRSKRSLRRSLARRSARKRKLRQLLTQHGLLPADPSELKLLFARDSWELRRRGLDERLEPFEFGRILLHLCQRRGALGLNLPDENESKEKIDDSKSDGKVKEAVEHTTQEMQKRQARTFGELIAIIATERRHPVVNTDGQPKLNCDGQAITYGDPVRNRLDSFEFHADRTLIRREFDDLWNKQRSLDGELAKLLTDELRQSLDNPQGDNKWRHQGALFGQRRTYWNTGTLGRCDLEPSDRCVAIADRHASYFRVLETVNNLRLRGPKDLDFRELKADERAAVLKKLRSQKTGSISAIRTALKIDKKSLKKLDQSEEHYKLNVAGDDERELNGDWFQASVVLTAIGEEVWNTWSDDKREGLNRAILKFDPKSPEDSPKLQAVAKKLGLDTPSIERLIEAWSTRPKLEERLKMSRRAVVNLLPYMETPLTTGHCRTQIEARQAFADDILAKANATNLPEKHPLRTQARRYRIGGSKLSKADRRYVKKHGLLPPAPTLSNPVVRKAIHEVRRHVIAHIRAHGCKPDQIVIEFARETTKPKNLSNKIFYRNLNREKIRKKIIEEIVKPAWGSGFIAISHNQLRAAVDRVILCMQQRSVCAYSTAKLSPDDNGPCAYSGRAITLRMAALGNGLEVNHILPFSRCGDNSLNNRVLCFRDANRNKGRKTPREWWGDQFDARSAPLRFMQDHLPPKGDYFERRDYVTKWRNFSASTVADEWKGSQLSDTAYAAREVQTYLQQALWPDEPSHLEGGERRILVTKGRYTAILRKDWQLYESIKKGSEVSPEDMRHAQLKDRGDHREHAIDAVAIALTDSERIQELARRARFEEEERAKASAQGREPERIPKNPIATPWGSVESFRRQVLSQVYGGDSSSDTTPIVVSHRPVKRKVIGFLHKEDKWGVVDEEHNLFRIRCRVSDLTPKMLRLPVEETDLQVKERLLKIFKLSGISDKEAKKRANDAIESGDFTRQFVEPSMGQSGLVRDQSLRKTIRKCLMEHGIDPDNYTAKQMAEFADSGKIRMNSGVPIKSVITIAPISDPVKIPVRDPETGRQAIHPRTGKPIFRYHFSKTNHHLEIREDSQGRWSAIVVRTYDAARRVCPPRLPDGTRPLFLPAVDYSDDSKRGGRFIMSLAIGDIIHLRHKRKQEPGYFVVFEIVTEKRWVKLKWHWDARRATGEKDDEGRIIPETVREEFSVSAAELKDLAPPGEVTPIKVSIDPLGRVRRLEPKPPSNLDPSAIDPRVMAIAQEALASRAQPKTTKKGRKPGSWASMHAQLEQAGLTQLRPQLSFALRILQDSAPPKS